MRHRHQSMRFDRSEADIDMALGDHRAHCSVLTGTEGGAPRWGKLLRAPDWEVGREPGEWGSGDPWVSWETSMWKSISGWTVELSETSYAGRRPHARVQRLRHWRGHEVTFICHHLPAHIETMMRIRRTTAREVAYEESLRKLRKVVLRQRRRHPEASIVLVGDWNLDLRKRWVRRKLRRAFKGTGLELVPIRDEPGTHGRRLIDWALTDLEAFGNVLPYNVASDHRPVQFTYRRNRA